MTRRLFAASLASIILIACLTASCSGHRQAGTGDVAFRLVWDGTSDLDLYVQDPAGNCVFFGRKQSDTGAILDVDCNDQICEHPVENMYWPRSTAPAGTYTYWIEANSLVLTEGPVPFELQLLEGERIVWRRGGEIRGQRQAFGPFAYAFATGREVTPVQTAEKPPCSIYVTIGE
jgi:hypothetical protein